MSEKKRIILSYVDHSPVSSAVCDYSCWISSKMNRDLNFLHTIEKPKSPTVSDLTGSLGVGTRKELLEELTNAEQKRGRGLIEEGQSLLQSIKERAIESGVTPTQLLQRHGTLAESLTELKEDFSLLVLGVRGENHERRKNQDRRGAEAREGGKDRRSSDISTQLEKIIRSSNAPIMVVNKEFAEPKKVMLAFNGSESCQRALEIIASHEAFKDIPCHIIHVGNKDESFLDDAKNLLTKNKISVTVKILSGNVEDAIAKYQDENQIDMTVMGAFSHSKIHGFIWGSFTTKMLAKTNRPLLLLR